MSRLSATPEGLNTIYLRVSPYGEMCNMWYCNSYDNALIREERLYTTADLYI